MEEYDIPPNDEIDFTLSEYQQPPNDEIDFTPIAEEQPDDETLIDLPLNIDLPFGQITLEDMETGVSIFITALFAIFFFGSLKLRSMFGMFGLVLLIVTLLASVFTNLPLMWFWVAVVIEAFVMLLASITYTRMAARGNR